MNTNINFIESQSCEFKQIWKDEYPKTICAFANPNGGVLYIGPDYRGYIEGIDDAINVLDDVPNLNINEPG